jgi:hypothetical protein
MDLQFTYEKHGSSVTFLMNGHKLATLHFAAIYEGAAEAFLRSLRHANTIGELVPLLSSGIPAVVYDHLEELHGGEADFDRLSQLRLCEQQPQEDEWQEQEGL